MELRSPPLDEPRAYRARSERFSFALRKQASALPRRTGAPYSEKPGAVIRRPRPQPFYRKFAATGCIVCPDCPPLSGAAQPNEGAENA
jgi:hypothetical protein